MMKLKAHFFLLNDDFSPEYAEANFNGEESENNPRYEWEDEMEVSDLTKIDIKRDAIFTIAGEFAEGDIFSYDIPKTFVAEFENNDGQIGQFAVSESIIDSYEYDESNHILKVYIKDYEPFGNPMPGVYIASKEFPKGLHLEIC